MAVILEHYDKEVIICTDAMINYSVTITATDMHIPKPLRMCR